MDPKLAYMIASAYSNTPKPKADVKDISTETIQALLDENSKLIVEIMQLTQTVKHTKNSSENAKISSDIDNRKKQLNRNLTILAKWADESAEVPKKTKSTAPLSNRATEAKEKVEVQNNSPSGVFQEGSIYKAKVLDDVSGEVVDIGEYKTLSEALAAFHKKRQEFRSRTPEEEEEVRKIAFIKQKEKEEAEAKVKKEATTESENVEMDTDDNVMENSTTDKESTIKEEIVKNEETKKDEFVASQETKRNEDENSVNDKQETLHDKNNESCLENQEQNMKDATEVVIESVKQLQDAMNNHESLENEKTLLKVNESENMMDIETCNGIYEKIENQPIFDSMNMEPAKETPMEDKMTDEIAP